MRIWLTLILFIPFFLRSSLVLSSFSGYNETAPLVTGFAMGSLSMNAGMLAARATQDLLSRHLSFSWAPIVGSAAGIGMLCSCIYLGSKISRKYILPIMYCFEDKRVNLLTKVALNKPVADIINNAENFIENYQRSKQSMENNTRRGARYGNKNAFHDDDRMRQNRNNVVQDISSYYVMHDFGYIVGVGVGLFPAALLIHFLGSIRKS